MTGRTTPAQRVRVALFLSVTLAVLVAAALVLGRSQNLFSRKVTLHCSFQNVGGLIVGSEVRLAGLTVGLVHSIHFSDDPANRRVGVALSVRASYLDRIRKDSIAQVSSKGLLGDAIVDISVGSPDQAALQDGDSLGSTEPAGLGEIVARVESAVRRVDDLAGDLDSRLKLFLTPEMATDFGHLVHSAADIAAGIDQGPGLAHALIQEPALTAKVTATLQDLEKSAGEIARSGDQLEQLLDEVHTGKGLLHELVYEEDKQNLVRDLGAAAHIMRQIAAETEEGRGTIGGLLKDPSIYEDLTTILGNIKRNALLKALIRSTISKDGLERSPKVRDAP